MIRRITGGVLLGLCLAVTAQANLLDDPGFETATGSSTTSNSAWVLDVNMPDGANTAAQFQTANWASNPNGTQGTGVWLKAFEGAQASGEPAAQASISQLVGTGSVVLDSSIMDLNPQSPNDGSWALYRMIATAPSGTTGVRVFGEMIDGVDAMANPQSAMFDDFELTESNGEYTLSAWHRVETNYTSGATNLGIEFLGVPEPASGCMALMMGLALIAWKRR